MTFDKNGDKQDDIIPSEEQESHKSSSLYLNFKDIYSKPGFDSIWFYAQNKNKDLTFSGLKNVKLELFP